MSEQITIDLKPLKDAVIQAASQGDGYISGTQAHKLLCQHSINEYELACQLEMAYNPEIGNGIGISLLLSRLTDMNIRVRVVAEA